jgi:hypothetical protein
MGVIAETGDLVGNWSWTVWLLIPLALVLALAVGLALGSAGEPSPASRRERGVSRYLAEHSGAESDKELR